MHITLTLQKDNARDRSETHAADADIDDLLSLLLQEPRLSGRVRRLTTTPCGAGAMGTATEALLLLLAPGGVATVVVSSVIYWLRRTRGDQTIILERPDGSRVTITATRVRTLDTRHSADLVRELAAALEQHRDGS